MVLPPSTDIQRFGISMDGGSLWQVALKERSWRSPSSSVLIAISASTGSEFHCLITCRVWWYFLVCLEPVSQKFHWVPPSPSAMGERNYILIIHKGESSGPLRSVYMTLMLSKDLLDVLPKPVTPQFIVPVSYPPSHLPLTLITPPHGFS